MATKKRKRTVRRRPRKRPKKQGILVRRGQIQWLNLIVIILIIGGLLGLGFHYRAVLAPATDEQHSQNLTQQQFIKKIEPAAKKMQQRYHVLPSITLAQAILESNWGQSPNARQNNNLFGVKASIAQPSAMMTTKEFYQGDYHTVKQRFRVYTSWQASIQDHAKLLAEGTTSDPQHYRQVINAPNYQIAAQALVKAGYATDPAYSQKLKQVVQTYHLNQYD